MKYKYLTKTKAAEYWGCDVKDIDRLVSEGILASNEDGLVIYTGAWSSLRSYLKSMGTSIIDAADKHKDILIRRLGVWNGVAIFQDLELYKLDKYYVYELIRSGHKIENILKYVVYNTEDKTAKYFHSYFDAMEYIVKYCYDNNLVLNLNKLYSGIDDMVFINIKVPRVAAELSYTVIKYFLKEDWRKLKHLRRQITSYHIGGLISYYMRQLYIMLRSLGRISKERVQKNRFGHDTTIADNGSVREVEQYLDNKYGNSSSESDV